MSPVYQCFGSVVIKTTEEKDVCEQERLVYLINSGELILIGKIILSDKDLFSVVGTYPFNVYSFDGLKKRSNYSLTPYAKNIIGLEPTDAVIDCVVYPDRNRIVLVTNTTVFSFSRDGTVDLKPLCYTWFVNYGDDMLGGSIGNVKQHTKCSVFASRKESHLKRLYFYNTAYHYRIGYLPLPGSGEPTDDATSGQPYIIVCIPDDIQLRSEIYLSPDGQTLYLRDVSMNTWAVHRNTIGRNYGLDAEMIPTNENLEAVWVFLGTEREIPDHIYLLARSEEAIPIDSSRSFNLPVIVNDNMISPPTIMDRLQPTPKLCLLSESLDSRCWVEKGESQLRLAIYDSSESLVHCVEMDQSGAYFSEGTSICTEYYYHGGIPCLRHIVSPVFTENEIFKVILEPLSGDSQENIRSYSQTWNRFCKI